MGTAALHSYMVFYDLLPPTDDTSIGGHRRNQAISRLEKDLIAKKAVSNTSPTNLYRQENQSKNTTFYWKSENTDRIEISFQSNTRLSSYYKVLWVLIIFMRLCEGSNSSILDSGLFHANRFPCRAPLAK